MLLERIRILGIALIVAALSVTTWKTLGANRNPATHAGADPSATATHPPGRAEWTIPVEIVEAGGEPRLHEVRVTR